jgi:uncharacterized protein YjiS (DUF1127 family)
VSTLSLGTIRSRGVFWNRMKRHFGEWRYRMRSRAELSGLDESSLQDIGLSHGSADYEASKPFWMA